MTGLPVFSGFRGGIGHLPGPAGGYLIGTLWFKAVYRAAGTGYGFLKILSICVFPFIIPDALKLLLAVFVSGRVKKHISIE